MTENDIPEIHILGTGGTIANVTGEYDSTDDFATIDALIECAPDQITSYADISYTEVSRLKSGALTPEIWFELHDTIMNLASADDPPDGVVVTHGSNTSEETAYFLNLVLNTPIPVVVTAAQRHVDTIGSESYKNLYDAIRVASSSDAMGRGVLLIANDEIHHARDVTKLVASRPDAWKSPNFGRIGDTEPQVEFYRKSERSTTIDTVFDIQDTSVEEFPLIQIPIIYAVLGADGSMVNAAVENDAEGIVLAAFPTGASAWPKGHPQQGKALHKAAKQGVPIVVCNRGLEGIKSVDDEFISGGTLRPQKARILLALGLLHTSDQDKLAEFFRAY